MVGKVTLAALKAQLAGLPNKGGQDVPPGEILPELRQTPELSPEVIQGLSGGDPNAPAPSGSEAGLAALLKGAGVGGEAGGDTPITESDLERLLGIQAQFTPKERASQVSAAGKASGLELLGAGIEGAGAAVAGRAPPPDRLGALLAERRKQAGAGFDTSRDRALADLTAEQAASTTSPNARAAQALAVQTGLINAKQAEGLTAAEAIQIVTTGTPLAKQKAEAATTLAAKEEVKTEKELETQISAQETLDALRGMSELNEDIVEGKLGLLAGIVGGIAPQLDITIGGVDLGVEAGEQAQFEALANKVALEFVQKLKGALSDKDIQFVKDQVAKLGNSREGNRKIIKDVVDRVETGLAQRGIKFTKTALAFDQGELPGGLTDLGDGTFRTRNGQIVERE